MATNSDKLSVLLKTTTFVSTDLFPIVKDATTIPSTKTATANTVAKMLQPMMQTHLPASVFSSNTLTLGSNGTSDVSFTPGSNATSLDIIFKAVSGDNKTFGKMMVLSSNNVVYSNTYSLISEGSDKILVSCSNTSSNIAFMFKRELSGNSNVILSYTISQQ